MVQAVTHLNGSCLHCSKQLSALAAHNAWIALFLICKIKRLKLQHPVVLPDAGLHLGAPLAHSAMTCRHLPTDAGASILRRCRLYSWQVYAALSNEDAVSGVASEPAIPTLVYQSFLGSHMRRTEHVGLKCMLLIHPGKDHKFHQ